MKGYLLLLFGAAILLPPPAWSQGPCASDIRQFCPGMTPGSDEFRQCLRSHRDSLSDGCRQFLRNRMGMEAPSRAPAAKSAGLAFIDTHAHLDGKIPRGSSDFDGAVEAALAEMDKLNISESLVMPPPLPKNHPNPYDYDDFMDAVKKRSGRFAYLGGGGSLNSMIQEAVDRGETSDSLKRKFEKRAEKIVADGAVGFGEMTAEHFSFNPRHPYESAPPDHPLFLLLADIAAKHNVPIDLHMEALAAAKPMPEGFSVPPNPKVLHDNLEAFERLLAHNPAAKIVWVHAGWDNTGERTPELCRRLLAAHANLYMSLKIDAMSLTETSPLENGTLKPAWAKLLEDFSDRFVIGTDDFYASPRFPIKKPLRGEGVRALLDQLPPELAKKIAVDNVLRIYPLNQSAPIGPR